MNRKPSTTSGARWVALGILSSKIFGLVREVVLGFFFGVSQHADVWRTAMRAPNVLQNLLGEQALSAAFIPIYSRMLEDGRDEDAGRFAGAVLALLLATVSIFVVLGILLAPLIVSVFSAGFLGDAAQVAEGLATVDRYPRTVQAVRVIFPMTGFLVLASWSLGVLNSHRRFVLPYLAPIVWNIAIITSLFWAGHRSGYLSTPTLAGIDTLDHWLISACWGAAVGGLLQFCVQLPAVLRTVPSLRLSFSTRVDGVRQALKALGPALAGRGVVQLGFFLDTFLASFLAGGAPSAIGYGATLFNLPLSAFGISIAAAELPELSRTDPETMQQRIVERIERAVRQSVFVIVPSILGYSLFGFLVVALLYRRGSFTLEDNWLVYLVLLGYTLSLLASSISRLLQNSFFALQDTRTPAKIASVRLLAAVLAGTGLMFLFDRWTVAALFDLESAADGLRLGAVGLSLATSLGAWCELLLLFHFLRRRLPALALPMRAIGGTLLVSLTTALPAILLWWVLANRTPFGAFWQAITVLPCFAVVYLGWAWWRRSPELELWIGRRRR